MFCIHCGKALSDEANFCPGCGKAVARAEGIVVEAQPAAEETRSPECSAPPDLPEEATASESAETAEAEIPAEEAETFVPVEDLSPGDVRKNRIFAWAIAAVPLGLDVIIGLGVACLVLNVILCYVDENNLKNQRLDMSDFGWETCIIPFYLYKRAKLLRDGPAYTIVWCVLFVLSILCAA